MKLIKSETTKMENEIIINSRCVEILREYKNSWKLNESEFALCDRIGREIADLLPKDTRINPIHCSSAEKILHWIEAGRYVDRSTSQLPDETKLRVNKNYRFLKRAKAAQIFWASFFGIVSLLWIYIVILLIRVL